MDECRRDALTEANLSKIRELTTMTVEVETVYVEYTTVVQQVHILIFCNHSSGLCIYGAETGLVVAIGLRWSKSSFPDGLL